MVDRKKSAERVEEEAREDAVDEVNEEYTGSVRNPLWQSATVSTNEAGPNVEDVSPIFAEARRNAIGEAYDAVKSGDKHPDNVVLPEDDDKRTNEEAVASLKDAKKEAEEDLNDQLNPEDVKTTDDSSEANAKSDADKADMAKKAAGDRK